MDQVYAEDAEPVSGFDIKRFLVRLLRNYMWLFASVICFMIATKMYLARQVPMYEVSSYIMLDPEQLQNHAGQNINKMADDPGTAGENIKDIINNEIFIFHSRGLVRQVVDSLHLDIEVSGRSNKKNQLLSLEEVPFQISLERKDPQSVSPLYRLTLFKNYYILQSGKGEFPGTYGQPLLADGNKIMITVPDRSAVVENSGYSLQFMGVNNTVNKYISRVSVASVPKAGIGMLEIAVQDELANRAGKIIDVLIQQYTLSNIQYNNQATRMAIDFLNKRLNALDGELEAQENQVSNFKAANKIYNVSVAADQLLNTLGELDNKKSENDLKANLLSLVESNIKSYNNGEEIVPNANGLQDPVLSDLINTYNQLVLKKRLILDGGTAEDPRLQSVDGQLEEIRSSILKNVSNIRKEIYTNKSSLSSQERSYNSRFEILPIKEKQYIQLNRTLGIKESLYVFLLQKKEESSIQLVSSDMPRTRIIDERISGGIVSPNKKKMYLLAFTAGLLLPSMIILLRFIFNNKVESREEIASNTPLTIAGEIGQAPRKTALLVPSKANQSRIAEQFRSLRTNLFYMAKDFPVKTILVTSFKQGEGKSFISSNLADSIAISGKRVIMLDFDLRKARLTEKLRYQHAKGIADFLTGTMNPTDIILPLNGNGRLFFIPSGHLPENPGELILTERMKVLFDYVKDNFDYIILDTAPVGVVSDAISIADWADLSLFVIRHNYSLRSSVTLINNLNQENKLPRLTLVINGIQQNKDYKFGGYGYGYQFNDYTKTDHKRFKVV